MFPLASFMSSMVGIAAAAKTFIVDLAITTCTRATTRTVERGGVLQPVPINTPAMADDSLSVAGSGTNSALNSILDGAVAGTPGTAPTSWGPVIVGGSIDSVTDRGIYNSIALSVTANRHYYAQTISVLANTSYYFSTICHGASSVPLNNLLVLVSVPVGSTISYEINGVVDPAGATIPSPGDCIAVVITVAATPGTVSARFGVGVSGAVTGSFELGALQFEVGSYRSPFIPTTTGTVTRAADICDSTTPTILTGVWAFEVEFNPDETGQSGSIYSSYTDANNYVELITSATTIVLRKRVASVNYDTAAFSYTHTAGTLARVQAYGGAAGTGVRAADSSADITVEVFTTNADTTDTVWGSSISWGSLNGTVSFVGEFYNVGNPTAYASKETAGW